MKPLYIFDLDGTLSLTEHRVHLLHQEKRGDTAWREFFSLCHLDPPNTPVIRTLQMLRQFADIWIFSGRSDEVRDKTVDWLQEHVHFSREDLIDRNMLTMRHHNDYTEDHLLKQKWLHRMLEIDRNRLVATFDDRSRVVKMWRDNGVHCFQVAPGDF